MKKIILSLLCFLSVWANAQVTVTMPLDSLFKWMGRSTIAGPKGDPGKDGYTPIKGKDYFDGKDGKDGKDGVNIGGAVTITTFPFWSVKFSNEFSSLQAGIDSCIKNNVRNFVITQGDFHYTKPLIVMNPNGFVQLNIIGESTFWGDGGTRLFYDGTDGFALGIQLGKGCKVQGVQFIGKFQPPNTNDIKKFFSTTWEDFKDGICRDSKYSPHAGIVIDPFTCNINDPLPPDGGYPGLSQYYSRSQFGTQTGSTGIDVKECQLRSFVVGIISSPNGLTRNAEILTYNKLQFENCKLCIASCQDQEKDNIASNIYCWGGTHTIFANGLYGAGTVQLRLAGSWSLDHFNLAAAVIRFCRIEQQGFFATDVDHVYAEMLGRIGNFSGSGVSMSFTRSRIDFAPPELAGEQTLLTSNGSDAYFRDNTFRYYGRPELSMHILGKPNFDASTKWSGTVVNGRGANHIEE